MLRETKEYGQVNYIRICQVPVHVNHTVNEMADDLANRLSFYQGDSPQFQTIGLVHRLVTCGIVCWVNTRGAFPSLQFVQNQSRLKEAQTNTWRVSKLFRPCLNQKKVINIVSFPRVTFRTLGGWLTLSVGRGVSISTEDLNPLYFVQSQGEGGLVECLS